ncbi:MAG: hypothetical protein JWM90_1710 [Thermoleophilia bacterium]|nr:hypothetical protein [Thermoleophilia bacterium]
MHVSKLPPLAAKDMALLIAGGAATVGVAVGGGIGGAKLNEALRANDTSGRSASDVRNSAFAGAESIALGTAAVSLVTMFRGGEYFGTKVGLPAAIVGLAALGAAVGASNDYFTDLRANP